MQARTKRCTKSQKTFYNLKQIPLKKKKIRRGLFVNADETERTTIEHSSI